MVEEVHGVQRPIRKSKSRDSSNKCHRNNTTQKKVDSESNMGSLSVLALVASQAEEKKSQNTMYSGNHNHGGRGGVQQPKRKRKNHDGSNKSDWNNTTEKVDSESNIGSMAVLALVAEQAQPEFQASQNCDLSFCLLSSTVDNIGHPTKSSLVSNSAPSPRLAIVSSNTDPSLGSSVAAGGSPTDWSIGNREAVRGAAQMRSLHLEPSGSLSICVGLSPFSGFHTSSIQSELHSSTLQSLSKAQAVNGGVTYPKEKGSSIKAGRRSLGSESRYAVRRYKPVSTSPTKISNGFPGSESASRASSKNSHQKRSRSRQSRGPLEENEGPSNQKRRTSSRSRSSNQGGRQSVGRGHIKNPMKIASSFKGVGYFVRTKRWEAHIWNGAEKKQEYLGAFSTEVEAARAYDRATLYFRGVDAQLHFQLEDYAGELRRLVSLTKTELLTMLKQQSHGVGSLYPTYPR